MKSVKVQTDKHSLKGTKIPTLGSPSCPSGGEAYPCHKLFPLQVTRLRRMEDGRFPFPHWLYIYASPPASECPHYQLGIGRYSPAVEVKVLNKRPRSGSTADGSTRLDQGSGHKLKKIDGMKMAQSQISDHSELYLIRRK